MHKELIMNKNRGVYLAFWYLAFYMTEKDTVGN